MIVNLLAQGGHFLAGIAAFAVTNRLELPSQIFIVLGLNTRGQAIITSLTVFPVTRHAVLPIEALAQVQVSTRTLAVFNTDLQGRNILSDISNCLSPTDTLHGSVGNHEN